MTEFSNKRVFNTGANRNSDEGKLNYEAFLSPLVLKKYAKYLHRHRYLEDGTIRDGDNWQKGMPLSSYMESLMRHFMDVWLTHRGWYTEAKLTDSLCGVMFNTMGMLHEIEKVNEDYNHGS